MLMHNGRVITCVSRQLKDYELNYPTHDLELADVVFSFKMWYHYVYEEKIQVYTYLKESKVPVHTKGAQHETTEVVGTCKRL